MTSGTAARDPGAAKLCPYLVREFAMPPILEAHDLVKHYGDMPAWCDRRAAVSVRV